MKIYCLSYIHSESLDHICFWNTGIKAIKAELKKQIALGNVLNGSSEVMQHCLGHGTYDVLDWLNDTFSKTGNFRPCPPQKYIGRTSIRYEPPVTS